MSLEMNDGIGKHKVLQHKYVLEVGLKYESHVYKKFMVLWFCYQLIDI